MIYCKTQGGQNDHYGRHCIYIYIYIYIYNEKGENSTYSYRAIMNLYQWIFPASLDSVHIFCGETEEYLNMYKKKKKIQVNKEKKNW